MFCCESVANSGVFSTLAFLGVANSYVPMFWPDFEAPWRENIVNNTVLFLVSAENIVNCNVLGASCHHFFPSEIQNIVKDNIFHIHQLYVKTYLWHAKKQCKYHCVFQTITGTNCYRLHPVCKTSPGTVGQVVTDFTREKLSQTPPTRNNKQQQ